MAQLTLPAVSLVAVGLGVASHLGYFIHGEHHWDSVRLLCLYITTPIILFISFARFGKEHSYFRAASLTNVATSSYLLGLSISITIYRVFFHRLRNFPGPFTAKLTKLSHVFRLVKHSDNYLQADRLHKKYGEFVR
jgi:cytochrome P450 family 628